MIKRGVMTRGAIVTVVGALVLSAPANAQGRSRERHQERKQQREEQRQEKRDQQERDHHDREKQKTPRRAALEEAYRVRAESVVRSRLNLNDDQMDKLRGVNARLGARRRDLFQQERETRAALKAEVGKGKGADQKRVEQLMSQAQGLQQQRMALQAQERKEVSQFLNPVQQAKYFGFQARVRKRAQELEDGGP